MLREALKGKAANEHSTAKKVEGNISINRLHSIKSFFTLNVFQVTESIKPGSLIRDEIVRSYCNRRGAKCFLLSKREKKFTIGADTKE
jgi:hypothetical protein